MKNTAISLLFALYCMHFVALYSVSALQEVNLNSADLIRGGLTLPEQRVVFTCITRDTNILVWQSEYIGANGLDIIQIYGTGARDNVTSPTIETTYATRVNVSVEDGVTVIVSQLFITASERFPTSSVTCRINHNGPRQTISFNTTARALQEVNLNSTGLIRGGLAFPEWRIVFTCVTRDTNILVWQSEYIGVNGLDIIQIYGTGDRNNVTSPTIESTYATRVSATVEDGVTVIVSQLFITASERFPTSSVTCRINHDGPRQIISFNTTSRALQDTILNSTLIGGNLTYSHQRVVFTCVTRDTNILIWQSEYIGTNGLDIIQIYGTGDRDSVTSPTIETTYATRVNVTMENGVTVIVSQLFITASEQFPTSSVTCRINHNGPRQIISFSIIDEDPPTPTFNSTLPEGVPACPGDRHVFRCVASHSYNVEWISEEYIDGRLQIASNSPMSTPMQDSGNRETYAMLESVMDVDGSQQLISSLNITVTSNSADRNHTITCVNNDLGTQQSMTFQVAETCEDDTVTGAFTTVTVTYNKTEDDRGGVEMENHTLTLAIIVTVCVCIAIVITMGSIIIIILISIKRIGSCKVMPSSMEEDSHEKRIEPEKRILSSTVTSMTTIPSARTSKSTVILSMDEERLAGGGNIQASCPSAPVGATRL